MKYFERFLAFVLSCALTACTSEKEPENVANNPIQENNENAINSSSKIDTSKVFGIDVAKYQGDLVSEITSDDNLDFIICKATEGETYTDPDFTMNWQFIKIKDLIRGSYHFYRSNDDPIKQAQFFVQTLKGIDSTDLPPMLDIEEGSIVGTITPQKLQADLLTFLKEVEKLSKKKPIIYSGLSFSNKYLNNPDLTKYDLWLAEYNGKGQPTVPNNWNGKGYLIWQKNDKYSINSDTTDFDVYNGSKNEFSKYIKASNL